MFAQPKEPFTANRFRETLLPAQDALLQAMTAVASRRPGSVTSLRFTEKVARLRRELDEVILRLEELGY